jgi:hypothetical protein
VQHFEEYLEAKKKRGELKNTRVMTLVTEYKSISIDDDSKVTDEVKHILTGQFTNFTITQ